MQPFALVLIAAAAVFFARDWLKADEPKDESARVASASGATSCSATFYAVTNRLDGSKARIYDCFVKGRERCVTYENGIASDSTETVRLVFATTLGSGKPSCL